MPRDLDARNRFIAREYLREKKNGPELAARFSISRSRVYQLVRKYAPEKLKEKDMTKENLTHRLPTTLIEPSKGKRLRAIADKMGLKVGQLMRWGVDVMLEKYGHVLDEDPKES